MLTQCCGNAKQRGLECNLTLQMIEEMLQFLMTCSATGLLIKPECIDGQRHSRSPWYLQHQNRLDNSVG